MTPKELRNLKKLIYSGDEKNIELAIALMDGKTYRELYLGLSWLQDFLGAKVNYYFYLRKLCAITSKSVADKYKPYDVFYTKHHRQVTNAIFLLKKLAKNRYVVSPLNPSV